MEAEHGTRDPCTLFDRYGDGICGEECGRIDPDCPPIDAERVGCGSSGTAALPFGWLFLPLLWVWPRRPTP